MSKHFRVTGSVLTKLEGLGIRSAAVLRSAGLPPELAEQPRMLLTTEEMFSFWRAIGTVSTDPAIGLKLGTESKAEHLDPIALAALSTRSFGEAVRQIARHKQLSCPEEITYDTEEDEWRIQFHWLLAAESEPHVLTDVCFAWILSIARHGTGTRLAPVRVEYMRADSNDKAQQRHFGCPVVFRAPRNAIVFRAADAQRPFVTSNADLLAVLAPQLDKELGENNTEQSFPERVRTAIRRKLTGRRPKIQEIARELHISSRTLQRRLQDGGKSFQQVLEEARHQLARYYLKHSVLELNEAAYLLGYEDAGSFVRAFRTWEGVPPAHWRESQRAKAAS